MNLFYALANLFGLAPSPRRSSQWPKVRKAWLKSHPACAACGTTKGVEVHHLLPFHLFPSMELAPTNLLTLCEPRGCHFRVGHSLDWRAWNPHAVADAELQTRRIAERSY